MLNQTKIVHIFPVDRLKTSVLSDVGLSLLNSLYEILGFHSSKNVYCGFLGFDLI